jgi:hypothetical protein
VGAPLAFLIFIPVGVVLPLLMELHLDFIDEVERQL